MEKVLRMYSESTSTLWMYLSTSTEYIRPRVHEYRVHLSTPKYVLEYTSTEYKSTLAPTLIWDIASSEYFIWNLKVIQGYILWYKQKYHTHMCLSIHSWKQHGFWDISPNISQMPKVDLSDLANHLYSYPKSVLSLITVLGPPQRNYIIQ